jgi:hypothetical protein
MRRLTLPTLGLVDKVGCKTDNFVKLIGSLVCMNLRTMLKIVSIGKMYRYQSCTYILHTSA